MQEALKQQLIETLVEYRITPYKQATNGKFVDSKIVILEPRLESYVKQMHHKTRGKVNFNDFYNDCIFKIIEAVMNEFVPQNGWQVLVERSNKKAFNQLVKFLKNHIRRQALSYVKENGYHTTQNVTLENGKTKKQNVYVSTNFSSIDVTVNDDSENETLISDTIEHGFWDAVNDESNANDFLTWYRNNYKRILTKSQCEFLNILERCGYSEQDKKTKELEDNNVIPDNVSTRLKAIEKRILKAWQKERSYVEDSFIERTLTRKISLLQIYLDLYGEGEDSSQKQLSDFIKANIDANVIENFLDTLALAEYKSVALSIQNKTAIPCEILNKLYSFAEMKIAELEAEIVKEQQIKKQLAEEKGVVLSKEDKKPIYASSLYLHLDSYGSLHNRTRADKLGA